MTDVFREIRERVSAEDAARFCGLEFDRRGWCRCPFHDDRRPSMSFRAGRFRCWACQASGDAVDFTARLLGLEPLAAARRLNEDFRLALPLDRPPGEEDRAALRTRREVSAAYRDFAAWREDMLSRLNAAFRTAHESRQTPPDALTDAQALAVRWQQAVEHWSGCLDGSMEEQMQIFRDRREIDRLCRKILRHTPRKSAAAWRPTGTGRT